MDAWKQEGRSGRVHHDRPGRESTILEWIQRRKSIMSRAVKGSRQYRRWLWIGLTVKVWNYAKHLTLHISQVVSKPVKGWFVALLSVQERASNWCEEAFKSIQSHRIPWNILLETAKRSMHNYFYNIFEAIC